jgi:hypothetical protein
VRAHPVGHHEKMPTPDKILLIARQENSKTVLVIGTAQTHIAYRCGLKAVFPKCGLWHRSTTTKWVGWVLRGLAIHYDKAIVLSMRAILTHKRVNPNPSG